MCVPDPATSECAGAIRVPKRPMHEGPGSMCEGLSIDVRRSKIDGRRSKIDVRRSKIDVRRSKIDVRKSKIDECHRSQRECGKQSAFLTRADLNRGQVTASVHRRHPWTGCSSRRSADADTARSPRTPIRLVSPIGGPGSRIQIDPTPKARPVTGPRLPAVTILMVTKYCWSCAALVVMASLTTACAEGMRSRRPLTQPARARHPRPSRQAGRYRSGEGGAARRRHHLCAYRLGLGAG
jgi:hypothetical protein